MFVILSAKINNANFNCLNSFKDFSFTMHLNEEIMTRTCSDAAISKKKTSKSQIFSEKLL